MKKNLIKTLAIGGIICLGAGVFTGCNNNNNNTNTTQITAEQIQEADSAYRTYANIVRDIEEGNHNNNLTITLSGREDGEIEESYNFYTVDGNKCVLKSEMVSSGEDLLMMYDLLYEYQGESYRCSGGPRSWYKSKSDTSCDEFASNTLSYFTDSTASFLFRSDFSIVEKDENGNYLIKVSKVAIPEGYVYNFDYKYRISTDGKFLEIKVTSSNGEVIEATEYSPKYEVGEDSSTFSITISYGQISTETQNKITEYFNYLKDKPLGAVS